MEEKTFEMSFKMNNVSQKKNVNLSRFRKFILVEHETFLNLNIKNIKILNFLKPGVSLVIFGIQIRMNFIFEVFVDFGKD